MRPWIVAVVIVGSVAGLGHLHPFGNPRAERPKGVDTLLRDAKMPAAARAVLVAKCADCHSNETRWPVYAWIAPGSWLMERDIVEARKKMNHRLSPAVTRSTPDNVNSNAQFTMTVTAVFAIIAPLVPVTLTV